MLSVSSISKRYGPVLALDQVTASFAKGEIHAVLGENGAGKSTLMSVLAGFVVPDSGSVALQGEAAPVGRPHEAKNRGIAMVHQHFTLVPAFTVEENLSLARLDKPGLTVPRAPLALAAELGWEIDPGAITRTLPVGAQQRIEILKALSGDAEYLIFDEPTAVLSPDEVLDLFRVLRRLRDAGKAIILIAHKLSEVMAIADRVTVLRRGKFVATAQISDVDASKLATWMVGEIPVTSRPGMSQLDAGKTLKVQKVQVKGDRGEAAVRGVSFEVAAREILGIGGVDGNGQVELAEALAGVRAVSEGSFWWSEAPRRVAYIPQDRQTDGLALSLSIRDNLLVGGLERRDLRAGPFLKSSSIKTWAERLVQRFEIKIGSIRDPASSLSGGNQQKIVVARNLDETPDLLVAVNPSRGLDIRATQYVHDQILVAAQAGAIVILISTDLDELAALSTRTLFISRGELVEAQGAESFAGGPS